MYTLARVPADGMLRVYNASQRIVHKESLAVHNWGSACFSQLHVAKEEWPGPDSDTVILALDDRTGACTAIWMDKAQRVALEPRLNKWRGCYGAWPIRNLSAT